MELQNIVLKDKTDLDKKVREIPITSIEGYTNTIKKDKIAATTLWDDTVVILGKKVNCIQEPKVEFSIFHEFIHILSGPGGRNPVLMECPYKEEIINYIASKYAKAHPEFIKTSDIDIFYPHGTLIMDKVFQYIGDGVLPEILYFDGYYSSKQHNDIPFCTFIIYKRIADLVNKFSEDILHMKLNIDPKTIKDALKHNEIIYLFDSELNRSTANSGTQERKYLIDFFQKYKKKKRNFLK